MAEQPDISAQCADIRLELKVWESEFSAANGGRRAGRADIKASVDIASKYKEYQRLRDILDGKTKPQPQPSPPSPKRPRSTTETEDVTGTPSKRRNTGGSTVHAATPTKHARTTPRKGHKGAYTPRKHNGATTQISTTPASASHSISTPVHKKLYISPTPQKDGIVLGIFDLLPSETPSKQRIILGNIEPNVFQTPQKDHNGKTDEELHEIGANHHERTPMSEGRRFLLDQFATPQKRKRAGEGEGTPSSARGGATPSFLKRSYFHSGLGSVDEEPVPETRKPRSFGSFTRSLSGILNQRKRDREEREAAAKAAEEGPASPEEQDVDFDDDEEALRELEGGAPAPAKPTSLPNPPKKPETPFEDDEIAMKLGADGEGMSDLEDSNAEDATQPRRIWKKRGQKRTTKRVIMRPVKPKAPAPAPAPAQVLETIASEAEPESDDSENENENEDLVPETQLEGGGGEHHRTNPSRAAHAQTGPYEPAAEYDSSGADSDYSPASPHSAKKRKTQQPTAQEKAQEKAGATTTTTAATTAAAGDGKKESTVKKVARKISATAHANFKKLKIKNKNSKAGGRGSWGRGRR